MPKLKWKHTEWEFDEKNPIIGLYGRQSETHITQLGTISLDTECQLALEAVVETEEPVVIPEDTIVDPTETEVVDEQGETDETIVEEEVVEEETIAEEDIIEVSDLTPAEQSEADLEIVETVTVEPQPEVEEPEEANSGMLSTILIIAGAIVVFAGLTFATIKAF